MAETKILLCTCKHAEQDRLYGPGRRVMNAKSSKKTEGGNWRCTVCNKAHD